MILITGGAGFIGSNFIFHLLENDTSNEKIIVIDKLTYAANIGNFDELKNDERFTLIKSDIIDPMIVKRTFDEFNPRAVINFAAESHVDRSINSPNEFIKTNINGTFNLLKCSLAYFGRLPDEASSQNQDDFSITPSKRSFKFIHISTDEVYGSLNYKEPPFTESSPYKPNSPYAASKAASDHLVRAWFRTYNLPTIISNCSNNYGPYQFPEKLIPLTILNATMGKDIPVYGDGKQVRDWLYVQDHCNAIISILNKGIVGETYNIGGNAEITNFELVSRICGILDELIPVESREIKKNHDHLIKFVKDRPGHDIRYAINNQKIYSELDWRPTENLETGLEKTVKWYLQNKKWTDSIKTKHYKDWIETNYGRR
ncbi:MAG: dTDP-glucose 4,6-dehydratase [Betaproteobacteria bacterium TMED82]|nr:MAG: dTDP-glucose 4,6-dehydratase [Betaproteobacteria bacterium TMED82]